MIFPALKSIPFLFLSFLLVNSAIAQETPSLPIGTIDNLSMNYTSPDGGGQVESLNLDDIGEYTDAALSVNNYSGLLIFGLEDKTFEIDISMLGVSDADTINISRLNYKNDSTNLSLNFSKLESTKDTGITRLGKSKINCQGSTINEELLLACLKTGKLNLTNMFIKSSKGKKDVSLRYFNLSIKNGSLFANFKGSITKNINTKIWGRISYDSQLREITLKITKAKAGIIGVKGKIFNELKKNETENMRVEQPYIYIRL